MNSTKIGPRVILFAAIGGMTLIGGAVVARQTGVTVWINGTPATADGRTINNKLYVPLADIAKAMNMTLVKRPGGFDLSPVGGANQLNGTMQGKMGERLVSPKWNFTVRGIKTVDTYEERYCQDRKTFKPNGAGDTLIVVDCTMENGLKATKSPVLTEREPGNTALADKNGQSYPPIDYDARQLMNKIQSYEAAPLLPGAKSDFALVFSIPKDAAAKALVFSLMTYSSDIGNKKLTDVRVSLGD